MSQGPATVFDRRTLLKGVIAAGAGFWLGGCTPALRSPSAPTGAVLLPARLSSRSTEAVPEGQRTPRGFGACRLDGEDAGPKLTWNRPKAARGWRGGRLRFTVALDFREVRQVEAVLARSGDLLGAFDVRFAYAFQPFELVLTGSQAEAAVQQGVILRPGSGTLPLWIFDDTNREGGREYFAPHLLLDDGHGDKRAAFADRMTSYASLQPFGWLEGCVLDGLQDMARSGKYPKAKAMLDAHLAQFIDPDGLLVSEDLRSRPVRNTFPGIEYTLPVAVIAEQKPGHAIQGLAMDFWDARRREGGIICDGMTATAEGSYTIGYPLAVIAAQTQREDLAEGAVRQILARVELLPFGSDLYLRCPLDGGGRTFRNWARAYAWYMLGLTRVWGVLDRSSFAGLAGMEDIRREAQRIAGEVLRLRQSDGLWTCFLDRPETGIDTSGSAGIAAALAWGARYGLLPSEFFAPARDAHGSLAAYLTPDGLLTGVAQHNAGGEALQSGGYRVLSQMGMGLLAQLDAALEGAVV